MAALWGLSNHPDSSSIPLLAISLRAQDPKIRAESLELLGMTASPEAIPLVRQAILGDLSADVRYEAALSLVELDGEKSFSLLAGLIENLYSWERLWVIRGFFHASNYLRLDITASPSAAAVTGALEKALQDDLPETRKAAAMMLSWLHSPQANHILSEAYTQEQNSLVKADILVYAENLFSPAGEALLLEALTSQDPIVQKTAQYLHDNRSFNSRMVDNQATGSISIQL